MNGAVAQAVRAQPIGGGEAGSAGEAPHQAPGVGSVVRPPLRSRKIDPLVRLPMQASSARAVAGARASVERLPPLQGELEDQVEKS